MKGSTFLKRQTAILIVTGALILSIAAGIIAVGVIQNRKENRFPEVSGESGTTAAEAHTKEDKQTSPLIRDTEETKPPKVQEETKAPADDKKNQAPAAELLPDFIAPVSGMLLKEHKVDVPVYSLTMEDYRTHTGVDIAASAGSAVRAAADGTVAEIWEEPMMGLCVSLEHKGGARSIYKNLALTLADGLEAGKKVRTGEVIGAVGESALEEIADPCHLHYELEIGGVSVNPAEYMLIGTNDTGYEG